MVVGEIIELYALGRGDRAGVRAARRDGWAPPGADLAIADAGEDTGAPAL